MAAASLIADLQTAVEELIREVDLVKGDPGDIDVTRQLLVQIDPVLRACARPGAALSASVRTQAAGLAGELATYASLDRPGRKKRAPFTLGHVDWIIHRLPRALELAHHLDTFAHDALLRVHVDKKPVAMAGFSKLYASQPAREELVKIIAFVPYNHDSTELDAENERRREKAMQDAATLMAVHGSLSPSATMFLLGYFGIKLATIVADPNVVKRAPHFVARVKSSQAAMHERCAEAKTVLDAMDGKENKALKKVLLIEAKRLEILEGAEASLFGYDADQFNWLAEAHGVRERVKRFTADRALLRQRVEERSYLLTFIVFTKHKGKNPAKDKVWEEKKAERDAIKVTDLRKQVKESLKKRDPGYIAKGVKTVGDRGVTIWPAVPGLAQPVHILRHRHLSKRVAPVAAAHVPPPVLLPPPPALKLPPTPPVSPTAAAGGGGGGAGAGGPGFRTYSDSELGGFNATELNDILTEIESGAAASKTYTKKVTRRLREELKKLYGGIHEDFRREALFVHSPEIPDTIPTTEAERKDLYRELEGVLNIRKISSSGFASAPARDGLAEEITGYMDKLVKPDASSDAEPDASSDDGSTT